MVGTAPAAAWVLVIITCFSFASGSGCGSEPGLGLGSVEELELGLELEPELDVGLLEEFLLDDADFEEADELTAFADVEEPSLRAEADFDLPDLEVDFLYPFFPCKLGRLV